MLRYHGVRLDFKGAVSMNARLFYNIMQRQTFEAILLLQTHLLFQNFIAACLGNLPEQAAR